MKKHNYRIIYRINLLPFICFIKKWKKHKNAKNVFVLLFKAKRKQNNEVIHGPPGVTQGWVWYESLFTKRDNFSCFY